VLIKSIDYDLRLRIGQVLCHTIYAFFFSLTGCYREETVKSTYGRKLLRLGKGFGKWLRASRTDFTRVSGVFLSVGLQG